MVWWFSWVEGVFLEMEGRYLNGFVGSFIGVIMLFVGGNKE